MLQADVLALSLLDYHVLEEAVRQASGPLGLVLVAVYSFLVAFVLPLPSEVVLVADLNLGLPASLELGLVVLVSGVAKATGSVVAFGLGQGVKHSGPVVRAIRKSRFDVVAWSERKTVTLARTYGYAGLAVALCVPGFPDTISIYAFSVLEKDYAKFAVAAFTGSIGRLLVTLLAVKFSFVVLGA